MEIFIVILIAFIILLFLIQHIKKWVIKISNDLVDGINQNIIQKENMIETNIKLLSKASIELENILKKNLKPIKKYVKSKKIPEIREFYKQHLILQKKPFLLPYETIDTELVLNSLRYSMWDTKNNNKIVQQRFFIWFTELIFEKKLNITDFNVINKKRFDEYGMNEGYLIILKYIKTDEYNSVLKARLKDKSSIEVDIKWHDWDNYHRKDYYFKSIRGIFEEDYNDLIKTINNKLIALYDGLDNILNKNEKIMIISLHEYLEFLSEACGIYANISINPYFLNDKNINFLSFLNINTFSWTPNEKSENQFDIYKSTKNLILKEDDITFKYKKLVLSLLSEKSEIDIKRAVEELKDLSENGYSYASLVLGMIYLDGFKVLKNPIKAKLYIEKSYEQGLTEAASDIWNKFELWK
ncbi:hypothetical protein N5T90_02515 [Aliarcobacter cryaerophilus]|uniref:hypothetical protein n=1 Tax=Aliarcobacter cryaerophilus TaxID=28198 RepID=UPI0021B6295E|nr:hypothetical protein [Aliarcobacter cryaerophilus]MCT7469742.1 hypothetical protein [Aliarcobacter cryaerophilus]